MSDQSIDEPGYLRRYGLILLFMASVVLWLLAPSVYWAPHREAVSWSALGVALAVLALRPLRPARGWRALGGVVASLALGGLVLALDPPGPTRGSGMPEGTYAETVGTADCSTASCAGHEAGWVWAGDNNVTDPDECGGRSDSFIAGCRAWAESHGQ